MTMPVILRSISLAKTPRVCVNLQYGDALDELLAALKQRQQELAENINYVPLAVKIAPTCEPG